MWNVAGGRGRYASGGRPAWRFLTLVPPPQYIDARYSGNLPATAVPGPVVPKGLKYNGQRWCALAGQDYESRGCSRYNGTDTVLSSSPFARATSATAWPSFNAGVTLTARKPALARSAFCTAARSETFALAIAAL